jgi:hypothetical protein
MVVTPSAIFPLLLLPLSSQGYFWAALPSAWAKWVVAARRFKYVWRSIHTNLNYRMHAKVARLSFIFQTISSIGSGRNKAFSHTMCENWPPAGNGSKDSSSSSFSSRLLQKDGERTDTVMKDLQVTLYITEINYVVLFNVSSLSQLFAFGRLQSSLPKALESLFDPPTLHPTRLYWNWLLKGLLWHISWLMKHDIDFCDKCDT